VKRIRELICEVYREHNPSKLDDVDNLLTKYRGREELVYRGICDKYKVEPQLAKKTEPAAPKVHGPEKYKQLITEIYAEHNKEKLDDIDNILSKYKGKEKTLYLAVCHKYNIEPKLPGGKEKKKKGGAEDAERVAKVKELIMEVYSVHNPSKLDGVDQLLAKYVGKEEQLYTGICEKYGVESKLPKRVPAEDGAAPEAPEAGTADGAAKEGATPAAPGGTVAAAAGGAAPEVAQATPGLKTPVELRQAYSELIREAYKEHNPTKLETVDVLLEKYLGQEQDLYINVCRKYKVQPQDPEGQGEISWMLTAEEGLARLIEGLVSVIVLHGSGLRTKDAERLAAWEDVRPKAPPCLLSHRFELQSLSPAQVDRLTKGIHGDDGVRWRKLQERCAGAEVRMPATELQRAAGDTEAAGQSRALTVVCDGSGADGRKPFDRAVVQLTRSVARSVRDCNDEDEGARFEHWQLPWSCEEVAHVVEPPAEGADAMPGEKREVGVEYRRGCWTMGRRGPQHAHSANYSLCGPGVEARLPEKWRELADRLWLGTMKLTWGQDLPLEAVVIVQATSGQKAQDPCPGMPGGCGAARPSASVLVTAPTEEQLDQAKAVLSPVLQRVLNDLRLDALFAPASLCMPQVHQPRRSKRLGLPGAPPCDRADMDVDGGLDGASSSSSSASEGEVDSEEIMSDAEPNESYRPLRLSRAQVRDAYLQGLLCLNCDASDHKHQDCPFRRKVCWNCHGNHAGTECPLRCRFCRDRHEFPLLECVKRVCRRVSDWKKSKHAQEEKSVLATFEQLFIKLEGFEDFSLAKHNQEVQQLVKSLAEQGSLFPGEIDELARSILNMRPPPKKPIEPATPPPPPGPPPKAYIAPKLPKEPPPPMPENKYPWSEKIFLDTLLTRGMYGSNVLSRIVGRGGANHRKMETESGARVFFRGLGVSGRDLELSEPIDCRLHLSVKGEVPQQGRNVERIMKDIIAELEEEIVEKGETGPRLDRPRDPDTHPFGFLIPNGNGPEDGALKFRFPEEDGQTLNDLLVWLKQAKLPLELDSDTQWRTTLQVSPAEPALPDDAPEEVEVVAEAFARLVNEWHYPSPYWYEEHDLRPTGLWTALTKGEEDNEEELGAIALQQGQGVRLSKAAVEHFATLLEQSELEAIPKAVTVRSLARLRGVVRRQVEDEQLLLYLSYPWAWFAEAAGRSLKLPFAREQVHKMLVDLGRIGGRPTESTAAPPFRGFSVEWMPLKAGAAAPEGRLVPMPPVTARSQAPQVPQVPQAMPQTQAPMQQMQMPMQATMPSAMPAQPMPVTSSAPRGFCKYWLPERILQSTQDIKELIAGPGGSHFAHVLKKYPSVDLRIEGQCSMAAPPAHRIHVSMSSEDSEIFESAAADVLDLVETVCDMVGEELGLNEDQVEGLIREVRAEKYFEAHGIRTPLPAAVRRTEAVATPAAPAPAAPAGLPVAPSQAPQEADFEFVDEDIDAVDAAPGGADTDDDARTEASDMLSDITEDDGAPKAMAFDDI